MPSKLAVLPQLSGKIMLCHTGLETDLIFNRGVELPGFASFPLLETDEGRRLLAECYAELIGVARDSGTGVLLDSVTWVANRDRAAAIGYGPERLGALNAEAIDFVSDLRTANPDVPIVVSGQIGPRTDAYAFSTRMAAEEAEAYHAEQIAFLASRSPDILSAFTLGYAEEAIGIVRAAGRTGIAVSISFTVETDGRLPDGTPLGEAIQTVDAVTDSAAAYFLVNCAHPEHFEEVLENEPWTSRLQGVVANASRASHAELDEAEHLDDGDPHELGHQIAELGRLFPHFTVFGGCCGTDMRHIAEIARRVNSARS